MGWRRSKRSALISPRYWIPHQARAADRRKNPPRGEETRTERLTDGHRDRKYCAPSQRILQRRPALREASRSCLRHADLIWLSLRYVRADVAVENRERKRIGRRENRQQE